MQISGRDRLEIRLSLIYRTVALRYFSKLSHPYRRLIERRIYARQRARSIARRYRGKRRFADCRSGERLLLRSTSALRAGKSREARRILQMHDRRSPSRCPAHTLYAEKRIRKTRLFGCRKRPLRAARSEARRNAQRRKRRSPSHPFQSAVGKGSRIR